jgi:hypothetical protein
MGQRHGQVKMIDRKPEVNAVDDSTIRSNVTIHARIFDAGHRTRRDIQVR